MVRWDVGKNKDNGLHCVLIRAEVVQQELTHKGEHKNGEKFVFKAIWK